MHAYRKIEKNRLIESAYLHHHDFKLKLHPISFPWNDSIQCISFSAVLCAEEWDVRDVISKTGAHTIRASQVRRNNICTGNKWKISWKGFISTLISLQSLKLLGNWGQCEVLCLSLHQRKLDPNVLLLTTVRYRPTYPSACTNVNIENK